MNYSLFLFEFCVILKVITISHDHIQFKDQHGGTIDMMRKNCSSTAV